MNYRDSHYDEIELRKCSLNPKGEIQEITKIRKLNEIVIICLSVDHNKRDAEKVAWEIKIKEE